MSAKPTPGQMEIVKINTTGCYDIAIAGTSPRQCIATFWADRSRPETILEAEANARAWVDGVAAMEKLQRIRNVAQLNMLDAEDQMDQILKILDEVKP